MNAAKFAWLLGLAVIAAPASARPHHQTPGHPQQAALSTAIVIGLSAEAAGDPHQMLAAAEALDAAGAHPQPDEPNLAQRWLARMNWPLVTADDIAVAMIGGLLNRQDEIFVGSMVDRVLAWVGHHLPLLLALYWRAVNSPEWLTVARELTGDTT